MKKEPWRIVVFVVAVAWIVFMWVKKDLARVTADLALADALPMIITSTVVTLVKVASITAALLLLKWLAGEFRGGKR